MNTVRAEKKEKEGQKEKDTVPKVSSIVIHHAEDDSDGEDDGKGSEDGGKLRERSKVRTNWY